MNAWATVLVTVSLGFLVMASYAAPRVFEESVIVAALVMHHGEKYPLLIDQLLLDAHLLSAVEMDCVIAAFRCDAAEYVGVSYHHAPHPLMPSAMVLVVEEKLSNDLFADYCS